MNPSAIVVTCGRVHDGSPITVVFVSVTALVPPAQWDHSVDANISLGPLVPHPRPFRWWISFFYHYFGMYHHGLLSFGNPFGRQCLLAKGFLLLSLPFIFLSILVWTFHLIVEFGSSHVSVPHPSPIAFSTSTWLCPMKLWGGVGI